MTDLFEVEARLDRATTELLPPLRATKVINEQAMGEILRAADDARVAIGSSTSVPRELTGKFWFVFTAMLAEADHSGDPEAILRAAWKYQDRLRRIFGPSF
jgi:hypothetical protein